MGKSVQISGLAEIFPTKSTTSSVTPTTQSSSSKSSSLSFVSLGNCNKLEVSFEENKERRDFKASLISTKSFFIPAMTSELGGGCGRKAATPQKRVETFSLTPAEGVVGDDDSGDGLSSELKIEGNQDDIFFGIWSSQTSLSSSKGILN